MRKTETYQLNQWDPADRIMMEDFNRDNVRIEAAIAAVKAEAAADRAAWKAAMEAERTAREAAVEAVRNENRHIRLLDITTSADAQQVDLDVSGIDFTQYLQLELLPDFYTLNGAVNVLLNGLTSYVIQDPCGIGGGADKVGYFARFTGHSYGLLRFYTAAAGGYVSCLSITGGGGSRFGEQVFSDCLWTELHTISLPCTQADAVIPAGSRIILQGVRK